MAKDGKKASHHPSGRPEMTSARHDVLYSKARHVLNQRHIKRPWFNLNPFLEKSDETIDLDNFLPEESKYIQRLESLVLCESYGNDLPVDTREIALEKFFEYLNSDEWKSGCSIRVLEGQLLDQLLVSLYRLEKENVAIRHTTYAFARNKRKITGCYKLADKEAYAIREETLLIEFAYFGRLTKDEPNEKTQNPMEYLRDGLVDFTDEDGCIASQAALPTLREGPSNMQPKRRSRARKMIRQKKKMLSKQMEYLRDGMVDFTDEDGCIASQAALPTLREGPSTQPKRRSRAASMQVDQFRCINLSDPSKPETVGSSRPRRGSIMTKHINAVRFVTALSPQYRRQSIATTGGTTTSGTPMTSLRAWQGQLEKRRESVAGTPDDSRRRRRSSVATPDGQMSTTRARRLSVAPSGFMPESDSRSPFYSESEDSDEFKIQLPPVEDEAFYGDEFYLTDAKIRLKQKEETTLEKLQRMKKDRIERREEAKLEHEKISKNQRKVIFPPMSPLNMKEAYDNATMHHTIKLPDNLPTFEEFCKLLKEDEYYDPRYRNKVRLKSKIIAQRYYIAKGMHRSSVMFNLEHLPDDIKYVGLTKRYMQHRASLMNTQLFNRDRRGSNGAGSKGKIRLPALQEGGRKTPKKSDGLSGSSISSRSRDPWKFAEEVHGVTDSEPCRDHCLKAKGSFHKQKEERTERLRSNTNGLLQVKSPFKSQTDLALSGQDVALTTVTEERSGSNLKRSERCSSSEGKNGLTQVSGNSRAGTSSPLFPKIELCDDEAETPDTDSEEEESDDDTPSLFDSSKLNVRYSIERLRKKRRMKRRRPAFLDILAKYYKMHAALKAFRKGSASREEKHAREREKRMGRSKKNQSKHKEEQEFVIGKLRKFSFNDAKPKKRLNLATLSQGEFSKPDLTTFHENLRKAIDDFVIRREIVVSDTQTFYRAATSVTFTRKSCFQKKHVEM